MSFGETVKNLRIVKKVTLRQFCQEHGYDPSNWSKIERGINLPPKDEETLERWAKALDLKPKTEAWKNFMLEAEISRGNIPREVMNDQALLEKLPAFFRTVRGSEVGGRELDNLIEKIRKAHAPSEETVKPPKIQIPKKEIAEFCRRHHIRRLALFGSVLRDDFRPASDVDVLVEFEEGHVPGWEFFDMEEELSRIFGRKVDLNTPGFLSRFFRRRVLAEAQVQYDRVA
jgi:predicted nucleotidyltransferase